MEEYPVNNENLDENEGETENTVLPENYGETVAEEIKEEAPENEEINDELSAVGEYEKITFDDVNETKKPKASKGVRVFALILAVFLIFTAGSAVGYGFAKDSKTITGSKIFANFEKKPTGEEKSAAQVYEEVNKSIVGIRIYNEAGSVGEASGVVYQKGGYIVTNDHIYAEIGKPKFKIYDYKGNEYDASYVAGDSLSDLALLKVDGKFNLPVPKFGSSKDITVGENVVAIGRMYEARNDSAITKGVISHKSRRMTTTSNYTASLIQTDSAINPGSSGGALVNMYGQIIGITSSKLAGVNYDSIGFAIPTVTVDRVVKELSANKRVQNRAKLGITYTEIDSVTAEIENIGTTGLYIASVSEDSGLYKKADEGDIITHVNGKKIDRSSVILDIIEESYAGDTITLTVKHKNGSIKDYSVKLAANVGESSYTTKIEKKENEDGEDADNDGNGGIFNFPDGE